VNLSGANPNEPRPPRKGYYNFEANAGLSAVVPFPNHTSWEFDHWTGALSGNNPSASLPMTGAKEVTAVFTQIMKSLAAQASGNGAIVAHADGTSPAANVQLVALDDMDDVQGVEWDYLGAHEDRPEILESRKARSFWTGAGG